MFIECCVFILVLQYTDTQSPIVYKDTTMYFNKLSLYRHIPLWLIKPLYCYRRTRTSYGALIKNITDFRWSDSQKDVVTHSMSVRPPGSRRAPVGGRCCRRTRSAGWCESSGPELAGPAPWPRSRPDPWFPETPRGERIGRQWGRPCRLLRGIPVRVWHFRR